MRHDSEERDLPFRQMPAVFTFVSPTITVTTKVGVGSQYFRLPSSSQLVKEEEGSGEGEGRQLVLHHAGQRPALTVTRHESANVVTG